MLKTYKKLIKSFIRKKKLVFLLLFYNIVIRLKKTIKIKFLIDYINI